MTKKDLIKYEKRLLEEKARILKQRGFTDSMLVRPEQESANLNASTPSDTAEQGYDTYQRELASRMASDQTKVLIEVDEALRRVELKTYGLCEICGKPIPKARLDVVPYTRYDMKCLRKREFERTRAVSEPKRRIVHRKHKRR
jgi:RNA polymerase-binding transcription factor DksA